MRDIPNTNEILTYLHCAKCIKELPSDQSPKEYQRLQAGWTPLGLQLWCVRCDSNIAHIDFEGQKHPANTTRLLSDEEKRDRRRERH